MLSINDLQSLEPGDAVEADAVFPGLSDEPLVLKVREVQADKSVGFDAMYYGVIIGDWTATYEKGAVEWHTE